MTQAEAMKILGMDEFSSFREVKKRYRSLMLKAHPDSPGDKNALPDAREINLAYEYLLEHVDKKARSVDKRTSEKDTEKQSNKIRWNAPVNPDAYCARDIFYRIEDADGSVIGITTVDNGKYYWTEDEDFSLFLKSLFHCGKKVLQEYAYNRKIDVEREEDVKILSEIVYLLSQQFVDPEMVLRVFAKKTGEDKIYQMDAMLEVNGNEKLKDGERIVPLSIRNHRLFLSNRSGREIGYLSFKKDCLYYGIIPLFERRAVQVKMTIQGSNEKKINGKRYREVDLYIKWMPEDKPGLSERIQTKIEKLLFTIENKNYR